MELDSLQAHIEQVIQEHNNRPIPEFEGFSPSEMGLLMDPTFETDCPVRLLQLSDEGYQSIPMVNQVKYLLQLIDREGELKLTSKGFLPTKVVAELYQQGFIKDELIEEGISKLYKETDSITINLTRILAELAGLVKKRKGFMSLTKAAKKFVDDNDALLKLLILTFGKKFNWAYYDGYGENGIGQLGYAFSLVLLSKYGAKKRLDSFYAEQYLNAYPKLLSFIEPTFGTLDSYAASCYSIRTFDRFLDYFGLITIEEQRQGYVTLKYVTKSELFDELVFVKNEE